MGKTGPSAGRLAAVAGLLLSCGAACAQDSVAKSPARNDALPAHDEGAQRARYVVDLAPVITSWGGVVGVAPVLKASRGLDPFFNTQILGSTVISSMHWAPGGGVTFPSRAYRVWTEPGAGVHATANAGGSSVSRTAYDRQFGVAFSDHGFGASGVVGAIVGQNSADLGRLYVERTTALASRLVQSPPDDTGTVAAGAIDGAGFLAVRADEFGASPAFAGKVKGENLAFITLSGANGRNTAPGQFAAINAFINILSEQNQATDSGATSFIVNNSATENASAGTFTLPTIVPNAATAGVLTPPLATLDLTHRLTNGATRGLATTTGAGSGHLASGVTGLRGPLSFGFAESFGNAGALAAIATTGIGSLAPPTSINVMGVRFVSNPLLAELAGPASLATMPSPIVGPGTYQANRTGGAGFWQFRSQSNFRGPGGLVGVGQTAPGAAGSTIVAATAFDASAASHAEREFIAVKTFSGGAPTDGWTVAAHPTQPVKTGPGGAEIGRLTHTLPSSFSAPGVDLYGNVYFVGRWTQTGSNRVQTGFFRAIPGASGYELELLVSTGRTVHGRNSGAPYEIVALYLADEDSIGAGAFHSGALMQSTVPGRAVSGAPSVFAFGGAVVNATIQYERAGGAIEEYDVSLFVGPLRGLAADANGDGVVDFIDLNIVLSAYTLTGPSAVAGDLNGDGVVDFLDLNLVLSQFGQAG